MIYSNYHTHTVLCDGTDKTEALIVKAIELGCREIGFSGHSYTWFDESYCMSLEAVEAYKAGLGRLREKYHDRIKVLIGVEQDFYCDEPCTDFDYVIGSAHYVLKDGEYITIDYTREVLENAVEKYYNGDFYAMAEDYYDIMGGIYEKTHCNIIGHFDLITKFNENDALFDTGNTRYRKAVYRALERLENVPALFELNTGAIAKGYRTSPYPQDFILDRINEMGGKMILSSDCHAKDSLLYGFEEGFKLLRSHGFDEERILLSL